MICLLMVSLFIQCCMNRDKNDIPSSRIFDGQTFDGWEGPMEFFRIENQSIVAGSAEKPIPLNQFLCTETVYSDFELTLLVKFSSLKNNAGVQFRSKRIPDNHEVIGYQADVGFLDTIPLWGSLYDESRRNRFLKRADAKKVVELIKLDDWNLYKIHAQGANISISLNDVNVLNFIEKDDNVSREGVICLQIHSGVPSEAWYKNIEIKELRSR